jgi:hypothetical protein
MASKHIEDLQFLADAFKASLEEKVPTYKISVGFLHGGESPLDDAPGCVHILGLDNRKKRPIRVSYKTKGSITIDDTKEAIKEFLYHLIITPDFPVQEDMRVSSE